MIMFEQALSIQSQNFHIIVEVTQQTTPQIAQFISSQSTSHVIFTLAYVRWEFGCGGSNSENKGTGRVKSYITIELWYLLKVCQGYHFFFYPVKIIIGVFF